MKTVRQHGKSFQEFRIGEVGCAGNVPITGLTYYNCHTKTHLHIPRIIILEPASPYCEYNSVNDEYQTEHVEKSGNTCIRADIYLDHPEWSNLNLGFLALENVVNDPSYFGKKDFTQLAVNLKLMMAHGGVVLFSEMFSIRTPGQTNRYIQIIQSLLSVGFIVIIDELSKLSNPQMPHATARLQVIQRFLLCSDDALLEGLAGQQNDYWLVFQKT